MKKTGLTDGSFVHTVIRKRPKGVHKGDCGRILLIVGSRDMAGAAVLCARAALRCGSGLVSVCAKKQIFPVLQSSVPEAVCTRWEKAKRELPRYDAVAIGPGMGVDRRTKNILKRILNVYKGIVIIDADGLNAVSQDSSLQRSLKNTRAQVILTPHLGEAARLLGMSLKTLSKAEIGQALFEKFGCIAVVKGPATLVALSDKEAYTNTTGNPGMATAGSGDTLTGIITSLAGQGLTAQDAARAGVYIHGRAGDLASEKLGVRGLTASDIADYVPFALKEITD